MRTITPETLRTERLILRPYDREDEPAFVAMVTDPDVMAFVGDGAMSVDRARRVFAKVFDVYVHGSWGIWVVADATTGRIVGSAEIKPRPTGDWEIVYLFDSSSWGRGFASEVGRALVRYGIERLELSRVTATVSYANASSIRVLEKLGMRQIGEETDAEGSYALYAVDAPTTPTA